MLMNILVKFQGDLKRSKEQMKTGTDDVGTTWTQVFLFFFLLSFYFSSLFFFFFFFFLNKKKKRLVKLLKNVLQNLENSKRLMNPIFLLSASTLRRKQVTTRKTCKTVMQSFNKLRLNLKGF